MELTFKNEVVCAESDVNEPRDAVANNAVPDRRSSVIKLSYTWISGQRIYACKKSHHNYRLLVFKGHYSKNFILKWKWKYTFDFLLNIIIILSV